MDNSDKMACNSEKVAGLYGNTRLIHRTGTGFFMAGCFTGGNPWKS